MKKTKNNKLSIAQKQMIDEVMELKARALNRRLVIHAILFFMASVFIGVCFGYHLSEARAEEEIRFLQDDIESCRNQSMDVIDFWEKEFESYRDSMDSCEPEIHTYIMYFNNSGQTIVNYSDTLADWKEHPENFYNIASGLNWGNLSPSYFTWDGHMW